MGDKVIEVPGDNDRLLFGDLTPEQFAAGRDWLSHEPVSYEEPPRPEDGQTWIALVAPTPDQISAFRETLLAAGRLAD